MSTRTYPFPTDLPGMGHILKNLPTTKGAHISGLLKPRQEPRYMSKTSKVVSLRFEHSDEPRYVRLDDSVDHMEANKAVVDMYAGDSKTPASIVFVEAGGRASGQGRWSSPIIFLQIAGEYARKGYIGYIELRTDRSSQAELQWLYRVDITPREATLQVLSELDDSELAKNFSAFIDLHHLKEAEPATT